MQEVIETVNCAILKKNPVSCRKLNHVIHNNNIDVNIRKLSLPAISGKTPIGLKTILGFVISAIFFVAIIAL